jgi:hypothetical protein
MNRSHLFIGSGACLASIGLFALSFSYRDLGGGTGDPGTMFVPRLILGLIFAVGIFSCVSAFLPKANVPVEPDSRDEDIVPGITWTAVIAAAATGLYLLAFQEELYFWATPVYLAFTLWLAGIRSWVMIASISLGFTLVAYYGFYILLGVPLLSV